LDNLCNPAWKLLMFYNLRVYSVTFYVFNKKYR
jgi:hypothetical protein